MLISFHNILPWLILGSVALNGSFLVFLYSNVTKKDKTTWLFISASTVVFLWTIINLFNTISHSIVLTRLIYATGVWIFPLFFIWTLYFAKEKNIRFWQILLLTIPALALCIAAFTSLLIKEVVVSPIIGSIPSFGPALTYVIILTFVSYGCVIAQLTKAYFSSKDHIKKMQLRIIITGFASFGAILLGVNFILPAVGYNYLIDFDVPSSVFLVGSIVYAISKYRLFNAKLLLIHAFVVILWVILIAQTIVGSTKEQHLIHVVTFIASVFFGMLLIRSVNKEVKQRERLEHLTVRLRDFVSFASHELRGPVSKFKSVISMIFEGDFGPIPSSIHDILRDTYIEAEDMGQTIDMFLNLNRIETGAYVLNLSQNDITVLLKGTVEQYTYYADKKNITVTVSSDEQIPEVEFDFFSIQHVIKNILSNAIKYNIDNGSVSISIRKYEHGVAVAFKDTGIGMEESDLVQIFSKYERSKESLAQNIEGHGIGMWLSKKIIELHGGSITAHSDGHNKGSTISFILPYKVIGPGAIIETFKKN